MKVIKCVDDFDRAHSSRSISLLNEIPEEVIGRFRSGLKFNKGHLAHSDYAMLCDFLPDQKLHELFAHFGISRALFDAIRDTSCVNNVCFVSPGSFCNPSVCDE